LRQATAGGCFGGRVSSNLSSSDHQYCGGLTARPRQLQYTYRPPRKVEIKEVWDAKASYTLLAPTNDAFAKLSAEYFAKLTNDPKTLRQLLLAHLLPGKVLFKHMFAPDNGSAAKNNVTKSARNFRPAELALVSLSTSSHCAIALISIRRPGRGRKARA